MIFSGEMPMILNNVQYEIVVYGRQVVHRISHDLLENGIAHLVWLWNVDSVLDRKKAGPLEGSRLSLFRITIRVEIGGQS